MVQDIVSIIEGCPFGGRGVRTLVEEHWSNILAWLFDPKNVGTEISSIMLSKVLQLSGVTVDLKLDSVINVERERRFKVGENTRYIDIVVSFASGWELHIENKVDRDYEDIVQLRDELIVLNDNDHLILLCPREYSLLRTETRQLLQIEPNLHHVKWLDYAKAVGSIIAKLDKANLAFPLIYAISACWPEKDDEDFTRQARIIIEEKGWTHFYPDDFKEAFLERFGDVYQKWVDKKSEYGNGGAHQRLTKKIAGLARRKDASFKFKETGNSRPPKMKKWGWPEVYEYEVVRE